MDSTRPPKSFWIVSGLALVWNLIGVATYLMQVTMSEEARAAMPDAQRLFHESTPAWVTGAYALAVHAGALASLFLLLRKAWAIPVFVVSVLCVLLQVGHAVLMTNALEIFGAGFVVMPLVILAIAVFLVVFSRRSKERGYLS